MPGGKYHFEVAVILRNSYLISSILSSSEVWYGVTKVEWEQLEQVDEMWIRNLFECSSSVPKELLYLELGILPIKFIAQTRTLLFLHHILQQDSNSLLYRFFMAQLKYPSHGDWISQALLSLENLSIDLELDEIKHMSKTKYKAIIKDQIGKQEFCELISRKETRTSENAKGRKIVYSELSMPGYLSPSDSDVSIEEKKWMFRCRL